MVEKVKALDALMTTLEHTQNAQLASVPGSVKTLEISINAAISSVKRVDGIASDITVSSGGRVRVERARWL